MPSQLLPTGRLVPSHSCCSHTLHVRTTLERHIKKGNRRRSSYQLLARSCSGMPPTRHMHACTTQLARSDSKLRPCQKLLHEIVKLASSRRLCSDVIWTIWMTLPCGIAAGMRRALVLVHSHIPSRVLTRHRHCAASLHDTVWIARNSGRRRRRRRQGPSCGVRNGR